MIGFALPALAQHGDVVWERLPGPYGGWAQAIASTTIGDGVIAIAADRTQLYRSADGGESWQRLDVARSFPKLFAAPNGDFWATGGILLRSTDGGITWEPAGEGLPAQTASALDATPDGSLYAATAEGVYRLSPDATTWDQTALKGPMASIAASTAGVLLAGDDEYFDFTVYRSTDAGASWDFVSIDSDAYSTTGSLIFLDEEVVLAGGVSYPSAWPVGVHRSTDAGLTWSQVEQLAETDIEALFARPGVVYANTWYGTLRSTNSGLTWEQLEYDANDLALGPGDSILLATRYVGILRSDDNEQSWQDATIGFGQAELGSLALGDDGWLFAAPPGFQGPPTGIHRSHDGGQHWERVPLEFAPGGIFSIHVAPDGALLVAPERRTGLPSEPGGGLFRSLDAGDTWQDVSPLDGDGQRRAVTFIEEGPDGSLWAVVGPGFFGSRSIYRSTDSGQTWQSLRQAPFAVRAFTVGSDGSFWVGSEQPTLRVARLADLDAPWHVVLSTSAGLRVGAIAAIPDSVVVVTGHTHHHRSTDLGETWESLDLPLGQSWHEVKRFRMSASGVLLGAGDGPPAVIQSVDAGATWVPAAEGIPGGANFLAIDSVDHGWVVTHRDGIYRTADPLLVSAEPPAQLTSQLALSVYPNPARHGVALVVVTGVMLDGARVEVFDLLGRRHIVLYDGPLAKGEHRFRLGAGSLPAGAYIVRVVSGETTAIARVAIVR